MKNNCPRIFKSKFVAVLVMLSQFTYLLPAQTYLSEQNYEKQKLDRYLDRASREKNAQDWERIAEEGVFAAMSEWESANTYLKETDYEAYAEKKAGAEAELTSYKNTSYALWYTKKKLTETKKINSTELEQLLKDKTALYTEQFKENDATLAEAQASRQAWETYAQNLVDSYLTEFAAGNDILFPEIKSELSKYNYTDEQLAQLYDTVNYNYTLTAVSEYQRVYEAEKNQLMAVLLYDTQSTKKLSASQAAGAIAREKAQEVKADTDATINKLFNEFETEISNIEGEDLAIAQKNWLANFQKAFDEGLQKWNDAEKEFLVSRTNWENEAADLFENSEEAWAEGYKILQEKKEAWFKEINDKLEEGRREWNQSEELLNQQLDAARVEMEATFEKERNTKAKLLDVQISIYEQSRAMLNIAAQGLECFAESFEKYNNRYSYWKTEDANGATDNNIVAKINELYETIQSFKNQPGSIFNLSETDFQNKKSLITELTACCQNQALKSELQSLIAEDGWLNYIPVYKTKATDAIEQLYKITGCVYNETKEGEITFLNELDIQILKSKVTLEYWNEEYDVALAVKEYAQSHSSQTETDTTTLNNLNTATAEYEAALSSYNAAVATLESYLTTVEDKQALVDQANAAMAAEKEALDTLNQKYAQFLLVFKGTTADTLLQKLAVLMKEYNEIKNTDTTEDFNAYYDALVEYNTELLKSNLYDAKNELQNGKTISAGDSTLSADTKSIQELTAYKEQINGYITNGLDLNSSSQVLELKNKLANSQYYTYEEVSYIRAYLDEYEANRDIYTDAQKNELKALILQELKLIEQYWQNEIDYRNGAISYMETGTLATNLTALTDAQHTELTVRSYLSAVLTGTSKWKNEFAVNFDDYAELFATIQELLDEPSATFISKVETECDSNDLLRALLQQEDIFGYTSLMNWIANECEYNRNQTLNAIDNQYAIEYKYSQYVADQAALNHAEAVTQIQNYIAAHDYKNLNETQIYNYINKLSELGTDLNIYGQSALSNYINGVIDYAGTKYAFTGIKTKESIAAEIETANTALQNEVQVVSDLGTLSYASSDLKSILGVMKAGNELYAQNTDTFNEYAAYLIMSKLFAGDLTNATVASLTEKITALEEEFANLSSQTKTAICTKILNIYNFVPEYNNFKDTIYSVNMYYAVLSAQDSDSYHLLFEAAAENSVNWKIAQANTFIAAYNEYKDELNSIPTDLIDYDEQVEECTNAFLESLSDYAKNNHWVEKYENDASFNSADWYNIYLADEKALFILLQSDMGYSYLDEAKDKLTNQNYKDYLTSYKKLNDLAYSYVDLIDGDVDTWVNGLNANLTAAEKATLIATLKGTGSITCYYNYENAQYQILNSYGAGIIVNNNIIALNEKISGIISDKYNEKYEEYTNLQNKYTMLCNAYNAIVANNVTWVQELKNNNITAADTLDAEANEAITTWVTNNNAVRTLLAEKAADAQRHLTWLYDNSSSYNLNVDATPGAQDSYANLLNNAYAKLYTKEDTNGIINEICAVNNALAEAKSSRATVQAKLEQVSEQIATQKTVYEQKVQAWKNSIAALKTASDTYNTKVTAADESFTALKAKEKAKRIAQEKYDYATSIYLKELGEIDSASYVSPEEKLVDITFSKQQAQVTVDVLESLKSGVYAENPEYTAAMNEYKDAVKKHYAAMIIKQETDAAIAVQEDKVREADQKVQEANLYVASSPLNMTSVSSNMRLVCIQKDANGNYSFSLARNGRTSNDQLMLEYFTKAVVPEKIVGGERNITQALADTRSWIDRLNKNRDYVQELALASVYFKYINGTMSLEEFSYSELPQDTIQGINCKAIANNYREEIFREAYESVMSKNGGEADLARYLIYVQDTSGEGGANNRYGTTSFFKDTLLPAYQIRLLNKLIDYCEPYYKGKIAESIALFADAAVWAGIAAGCPWPANLIPAAVAAGLAIAGGTAAYKASVIKNDLIEYMKNKISGLKKNISTSAANEQGKLNDVTNAKKALSAEWSCLNKMVNGCDSEESPAPTCTLVQTAMNARIQFLLNKNTYAADITNIYTKAAFDASGAASCQTVGDAVDKINQWYETQERVKEEKLTRVVSKLQTEQNEKTLIFSDEVSGNANLSAAQKAALHTLAVKASNQELTAEERAKAKSDFETLSAQYLAENTAYKTKLASLAAAAWGTKTWHSDVYFKDRVELAKDLYRPNAIDLSNATESYSHNALMQYKTWALNSFDQAVRAQMAVYDANQDKERTQLQTKRNAWENQMILISNLAEVEWNKAGESLVSGYNEWKRKFIREYTMKTNDWDINYAKFLEKKQAWVNEQYLYAVNRGNENVLENSGLNADEAISAALAQINVDSIALDVIDPAEYTNELIANTSLSKMMNSVESLQHRGKNAAVTKKHGSAINTSSIETIMNAQVVMMQMEEAIENAAARLAGEQAAILVEKSIEASMERIDQENKSMRDWEIALVQSNSYTVKDTLIERDAVIDSTIAGAIYEHQTVAYYQDFTTQKPTLKVSLSKTMLEGLDSSSIMLLLAEANSEIDEWNTSIFGATETDEEGNTVQKQTTMRRSDGESISAEEKKEYDALLKKGYTYLTKEEKERFDTLSSKIVTVRDGELGEWIGYAPLFKDSRDANGIKDSDNKALNLDMEKGRDANIKYYGQGQMGAIMLDFQWNSIKEGQGWGKLAMPMYDQALWYSGDSWFKAPTLRSVVSITFDAIGLLSGQEWFAYADDLIFAACDLGGGFKSAEEVGLDLAKTAATAVISMGCSAVGEAASKAATTAMKGASTTAKAFTKGAIMATTTYASVVGSNAVNNVYIDPETGGLKFDNDGFVNSLGSAGTIATSLAGGVAAGLTYGVQTNLQGMGDRGAAIQKKYGAAIGLGVSAAQKVTEYGVYSAYALAEGRTMADAFDDMGGLTFNLLDIGSILDMISSNVSRNNETGSSGWDKAATKLNGFGILEFNIGTDGITGSFGTGGINIVSSLYDLAKRGGDMSALEAALDPNSENYDEALAAYLTYIYGDRAQENTAMRITEGKDNLEITDSKEPGMQGHTAQNGNGGRDITIANQGNAHENAVVLGHEAYRDGDKNTQGMETLAALLGHAGIATRMNDFQYMFGELLTAEIELYKSKDLETLFLESMFIYDSTDDFWKLTYGGQLEKDNDGWLKNHDGKYINNDGTLSDSPIPGKTYGSKGIQTGLINILHATSDRKQAEWDVDEYAMVGELMKQSGFEMNSQEMWTDVAKGKRLDMQLFMAAYADTIAATVFNTYYNNLADLSLANLYGMDLGFKVDDKQVTALAKYRYQGLLMMHAYQTKNKTELWDKYYQTISNSDGDKSTFFKVDENNPFLDQLVKQIDPVFGSSDADPYYDIHKAACNWFSIMSYPQLMTGNILTADEIKAYYDLFTTTTSKWWEDGSDRVWMETSCQVWQPDLIANYVMNDLNTNNDIKFTFTSSTKQQTLVGYKIKVPYSTTGHFVTGAPNRKIIANSANGTGSHIQEIKVYAKKNERPKDKK